MAGETRGSGGGLSGSLLRRVLIHPERARWVADFMNRQVVTIAPATSAGAAWLLAAGCGFDHLLVLDGRRLVGVISSSELAAADSESPVSLCMRTPVLCVENDCTLMEAACVMEENGVSCLPVVHGDMVVGLITAEILVQVVRAMAIDGVTVEQPLLN